MTEEQEVIQGAILIRDHLALADTELSSTKTKDELKEKLVFILSHLLDKDMQRLLNALYRIDVDENKFKKILAESEPDQIAHNLADEIIERELKKVRLRAKYSGFS